MEEDDNAPPRKRGKYRKYLRDQSVSIPESTRRYLKNKSAPITVSVNTKFSCT